MGARVTPPVYVPPTFALAMLTMTMALEIADDAARSDVETEARPACPDGDGLRWYDTADRPGVGDPVVDEMFARAVQYLEMRELVVRHPEHPLLVRFAGPP